MELKTIDEMKIGNCNYYDFSGVCLYCERNKTIDDIKAEAVKWVKYFSDTISTKLLYKFFNLTEEDLGK